MKPVLRSSPADQCGFIGSNNRLQNPGKTKLQVPNTLDRTTGGRFGPLSSAQTSSGVVSGNSAILTELPTRLAERGRFELPVGYKPTHAFQACALNHSAISPATSLLWPSPCASAMF